ncbi:MAG: AAA family ATPase [Bacillota bacterium]|nr:AAA family ATPase [Bacillota bacterium]
MNSAVAYGSFVKYGMDIFRTATYLQWGNSDSLIGACILCNPGIAVLEARGLYIHGPVNEGREFSGILSNNGVLLQLIKLVERLYDGEKLEGTLCIYNLFTLLDAPAGVFEGTEERLHAHKDILFRGYTDFIKYCDSFPWVILAWGCDSRNSVYNEKKRWLDFIEKKGIPVVGVEALEYPNYIHLLQQGEWRQKKYIEDIIGQFRDRGISLKAREVSKKIEALDEEKKIVKKMPVKQKLFTVFHEEREEKKPGRFKKAYEAHTGENPDLKDISGKRAEKERTQKKLNNEGTTNYSVTFMKDVLKENYDLIEQKNYQRVLENCHKAMELDDRFLPLYIQRSTVLELMNDVEGAVRNLGEVLVKTRNKRLQDMYDAKVAEYRGEYDKALRSYKNAVEVMDSSANAGGGDNEVQVYLNNSIGKLLVRQKKYQEALPYFDRVLNLRQMKDALENREKALSAIAVRQTMTEAENPRDAVSDTAIPLEAALTAEEAAADRQKEEAEKLERPDSWMRIKTKLDALVGLNNVKRELFSIMNYLDYERKRSRLLNLSEENLSYHFVFTGNPGTGKTTVARLLGEMLVEAGVLKKGHVVEVDRSKLVGQYVGQTAVLTRKAIESAMDGILFIDEAYSLNRSDSPNDYGIEAVDTLVKAMEDYRGRFVVILAGYTREINKLMQLNPGLKSRINVQIQFDNYNDEELLLIAKKNAAEKHYELDADAEAAFIEKINRLKVDENFANGRTVRNIVEEAIRERAFRIGTKDVPEEELEKLSAQDFGRKQEEASGESIEDLLETLNGLTGLEQVKSTIGNIFDLLRLQSKRKDMGLKNEEFAVNMIFAGKPGTGKTTVARILGRLFRQMGLLKMGQLVEVTRKELVGEYVGQTSSRTMEKIREAYGGILFIDEAYTLAQGGENDFGREALSVLIKEMEDNRDKLMVIFAGYTDEMEKLLSMNPGLKSRIGFKIEFPDYSPEELVEIFLGFCKSNDYIMSRAAEKVLLDKFREIVERKDKTFGNARLARQIFEKARMKQANRVMEGHAQEGNTNGLMTITYVDILGTEVQA